MLNETGTLHRVRHDLEQAQASHEQALLLARETGSARDEACAVAGLGRCALAADRVASARASLGQAREIFRSIGAVEADELTAELDASLTPIPRSADNSQARPARAPGRPA